MFKRNNLLFNFLSFSRFCWLNLPVHWQTWSLSLFVISKSFLNLFTSWEAWLFWMDAWVDSVLYVSAACIIQIINLQVFDLIFTFIYVNPNCAWTNTYDVRFIQTFNFQKHYYEIHVYSMISMYVFHGSVTIISKFLTIKCCISLWQKMFFYHRSLFIKSAKLDLHFINFVDVGHLFPR